MEGEEQNGTVDLEGKEAVRVHFVQRLAASGLKPAKGMTQAQHDLVMKKLVEFLAYLSVPSLVTLADQVLSVAGGKTKDIWPSEVMIRQMAEGLERRPFEQAPIITSWLASVEGPQAEAGGYLAQLFRHLREHRRPIGVYDLKVIKEQAAKDRHKEAILREREHLMTDEERRWRVMLADDLRAAREIVDRGQRNRDAKQQGAAA